MAELRPGASRKRRTCGNRRAGQTLRMAPSRASSTTEPAAAPAKFEDLLARLEQIVDEMEHAELPLEKLLSSYEEGMRLVKACGDRLADAEQKVEILTRSVEAAKPADSPPPSSEGAPSATQTSAPIGENSPAPESAGEIRLF